jgi:hypothetical protein
LAHEVEPNHDLLFIRVSSHFSWILLEQELEFAPELRKG